MTNCKEIDNYINIVRQEEYPCCKEQKQLCDYVERIFREERLTVDDIQLHKYMGLQKYFEFQLLPWERFVFALHNCVYKEDGQLRWPELFLFVGRGAGKNGYLAFEDFALLTPINGIPNYNIDIFATSEDQAKTTYKDVYDMLEANKPRMVKYFKWNLEVIRNVRTGSELRFRTSNPKTKDGGRPGKVDFDEYHQYENNKMIEVAITGLGKKSHPRETIITSNGEIRDGPLDHKLNAAQGVLAGKVPDNGTLYFICRIDEEKEVHDKRMWHKANPSLRYFPALQMEMEREYEEYKLDNASNRSFMIKRMNRTAGDAECEVTKWENLLATARPLPELDGMHCVAGIDYAKTDDFVSAGILFERDNYWYWITHSWVCRQSRDWSRIRFPLEQEAAKGHLDIVDSVEISPDLPAEWLADQARKYYIYSLAYDSFRHLWLEKSLRKVGFDAEKDGSNNIKLIRPSDIMRVAPMINSQFANQRVIWEENPLMRWYVNNAKLVQDVKGNITYGKIEPKSRKTDGFMAFTAAATQINSIQGWNDAQGRTLPDVYIYG